MTEHTDQQQPKPVRAWPAETLLRCVPFTDHEIEAAIRRHTRSECGGACLSVAAGREVLRLRRAAAGHGQAGGE